MYSVSNDFHTAVKNGARQCALLSFDDALFTNSDIVVTSGTGIRYTSPFCSREELTIGLCPSSYVDISLLNEEGQLDTFTFGKFSALLGVLTTESTFTPTSGANASIDVGGDVYSVHDSAPYVRVNGSGLPSQPGFIPKAIIYWNSCIYVISAIGEYFEYCNGLSHDALTVYTHTELGVYTHDELNAGFNVGVPYLPNDMMIHKGIEWAANGSAIKFESTAMTVYYQTGDYEVFELCPLGVFNAERPATIRKLVVKLTAYDDMDIFDEDITAWFAGLSYPITLGAIYSSLCAELGVTTTTSSFINSTHSYTEAPFTSTALSGRTLLKYIAQAASSIARFDRDGNLELAWFNAETFEYDTFFGVPTIAEYQVSAIDKLQVQAESTDETAVIGTGTNVYYLLGNRLIVGADSADLTAFGTDISTRLFAYSAFTPLSAKVVCDWSVESGDIIDVTYNSTTYDTPIYTLVIAWNGACRSVITSTGQNLRDANSIENRDEFETRQRLRIEQISADRIDVENLFVKHLDAADGTFDDISIDTPSSDFLDMRINEFPYGGAGRYASGIRWDYNDADEWAGIFEDDFGNFYVQGSPILTIWTNPDYSTGQMYLIAQTDINFQSPTVYFNNDIYVGDNCSALSFTDRTPSFQGDALSALSKIKDDKDGNIDHATLPKEARKKIMVKGKAKGRSAEKEEDGRDLGMMISILTKGMQELLEIVNKQQTQIDELLKKEKK